MGSEITVVVDTEERRRPLLLKVYSSSSAENDEKDGTVDGGEWMNAESHYHVLVQAQEERSRNK